MKMSDKVKREYEYRYKNSQEHFVQRLKHRYNIDITFDEYDALCKKNNYQGKFAKTSNNSLGTVTVKGVKVWAIYNSRLHIFTTVLPPEIEFNIQEMIRACFPRALRSLAYRIYELISDIVEKERYDFKNESDAAKYYFREKEFSYLLFSKYKLGEIPPIKYCYAVKTVIENEHPTLTVGLVQKELTEVEFENGHIKLQEVV